MQTFYFYFVGQQTFFTQHRKVEHFKSYMKLSHLVFTKHPALNKAEVHSHYNIFYSILLSFFKSNMSVASRLAHKFSLTCHNRFIAGCCRSGGLLNTRVHSGQLALGLHRLLEPDFLIPLVLLWSEILRQEQPLPAGSGQVGGLGFGWPGLITTLPIHGTEMRREAEGRDDNKG